ncbi:hypothetical protein PPL_10838 [Heterostelium album PN500]|uniref:Uncharacterized protein n=1 Tax=Heterostelium pallidum (strain ATCC 26659 / Pp 5 / PN500) TaxID=670386 RepID=D3BS46_HETP5|nr:hypothetical protein PPL_10838 [Heterostelium album PN500]EFA75783.1 hypothetical protein PPL_10838 [Heterostelium album PN500]|eukprot:XP_020427917.1 hypothetical protein PPL_10838 [Heterostelium album PN500]
MVASGSDENNINFGFDGDNDQTCSLRELRLPTFIDGPPKFKLPTTIEYLDIGNNDLDDILHLLPPTLNTLHSKCYQIIYRFKKNQNQTIRKLDDNYNLLYSENECSPRGKLIAKMVNQSKLELIFSKGIE